MCRGVRIFLLLALVIWVAWAQFDRPNVPVVNYTYSLPKVGGRTGWAPTVLSLYRNFRTEALARTTLRDFGNAAVGIRRAPAVSNRAMAVSNGIPLRGEERFIQFRPERFNDRNHTRLSGYYTGTRFSALILLAPLAAGDASARPAAPPRNRIVRVVTVSQAGLDRSGSDLLEKTLERLEQSASFRPDIACLPEVFLPTVVETVPGPVTGRLAAWARKNSSYVVFGLKTRRGDRLYNSGVLLDRQGWIAGQFHKIHPTESELASGIHPGDPDPPVFETDFGAIGIEICFDVNWWDVWKKLKQKGAKIVFFPAAYPAALQLSALALMNQFYVVSSAMSRSSRIYDITGQVLTATGQFQEWAGAALPVGKRLFEIDFHARKAREIQKKYGPKVELVWFHEDDWFTLASLDPDLTVEDLIAEFGLIPLDEYRIRAARAVDEARSKAR